MKYQKNKTFCAIFAYYIVLEVSMSLLQNIRLTLFVFFLPALLSKPAWAQETLKKEKIYTLTSNEVVAYDENALGLHQDEAGYIVVTADVKKFSRNYHIQGKIYGPFDRKLVEKPTFNLDTWGFIDSKGEESYVVFNGKEIGTHKQPLYPVGLKVTQQAWAYVLLDQEKGTTEVIINGKAHGPYLSLYNYYLSEDGQRWAIIHNENPEEFFVDFHDGTKVGPYKNVYDFHFIESKHKHNRWVLLAETKNEKPEYFTVVTNTGEIGTFEQRWARNPAFDFKSIFTIGANYGLTVIKDQKPHFLANDKIYGPYQNAVTSVDMGKDYNKFNYIVPETRNLHFTGDGIFSRNVDKYYVSESRKTVLVVKKAGANRDSLYVNDKYFSGVYNKIISLKFAPEGEKWCAVVDNGNSTYSLHFDDKRTFGPYKMDISHGLPTVLLGRDGINWGLYYVEAGTNKNILLVNNKARSDDFIGNIAIVKEKGKEYFSWFTLEDKTVFLNMLLLQ